MNKALLKKIAKVLERAASASALILLMLLSAITGGAGYPDEMPALALWWACVGCLSACVLLIFADAVFLAE